MKQPYYRLNRCSASAGFSAGYNKVAVIALLSTYSGILHICHYRGHICGCSSALTHRGCRMARVGESSDGHEINVTSVRHLYTWHVTFTIANTATTKSAAISAGVSSTEKQCSQNGEPPATDGGKNPSFRPLDAVVRIFNISLNKD